MFGTCLCSLPNCLKFFNRRKSPSPSPRWRKSRSPTPRRRKSRSPSPRRYKRQRSRSTTTSPICKSRSPSVVSVERKNATEKLRKEEEDKKRYTVFSSSDKWFILKASWCGYHFHFLFCVDDVANYSLNMFLDVLQHL